NQAKSKFLFFFCGPFGAAEARDVVIRQEGNKQLGMRVKRILPKNVCDAAHGCTSQKDIADREEEGKIEEGGEPRVYVVPAFSAALKIGSNRRVRVKNFADRRQLWIKAAKLRVPIRPEFARNVGKGVFPQPIEARGLDPPHDVLLQVLR